MQFVIFELITHRLDYDFTYQTELMIENVVAKKHSIDPLAANVRTKRTKNGNTVFEFLTFGS